MPPGVPVAVMGIDGATDAGLYAVRWLAVEDEELDARLVEYIQNMHDGVIEKNQSLQTLGPREYLKGMQEQRGGQD